MRHATRSQRLSRPTALRHALLNGLVKGLILRGQVRTTHAKAKEAQRLADRLVTLGKDGSVHARRQALRILQDRTLVKRLFAEIAPNFAQTRGGYTRVLRLSTRRGDGAQEALLALSRLPAVQPAAPAGPKPAAAPKAPPGPQRPQPQPAEAAEKRKGFFEGLRQLWPRRKKSVPPRSI